MSGLSSPSALITANAASTSINVYSIAKIGLGLAGLLIPAFTTTTSTPFKFAARGQFKASKPTANTATPASGSPSESALAVRLVAARDIALGLLMRDTTASVVVRALQADIFVSLLEIASTAAGYIEGTLSQECVGLFSLLALLNPSPLNDSMFPYLYRTAISVAGFSAVFASFGLWILNH